MRPAREGDIPVRVKNSYNPKAPGTVITHARDMSKVCKSTWKTEHHCYIYAPGSRLHSYFFVLTAGRTNQHRFEKECDHVGYC